MMIRYLFKLEIWRKLSESGSTDWIAFKLFSPTTAHSDIKFKKRTFYKKMSLVSLHVNGIH